MIVIDLENFAKRASIEKALVNLFKIFYSDLDNIKQEFHRHNFVTENPDFETEKDVITRFDYSYYTIKLIYHSLIKDEPEVPTTSAKPNVRLP